MVITFFVSLLLAVSAQAADPKWNIDTPHTSVVFKIRHLTVSWVHGKFPKVTGTVHYVPGKLEEAKADIVIDVASIDTGNSKRDNHLRSADFFNVEKFPKMTFRSKKVQNIQKGSFELVGDLTLRGITKEVVMKVEGPTKIVSHTRGRKRFGASATLKINREYLKFKYNSVMDTGGLVVGNEVYLTIDAEMNQGGKKRKKKD
jgi:polyisoprenoid-binding protein YceI